MRLNFKLQNTWNKKGGQCKISKKRANWVLQRISFFLFWHQGHDRSNSGDHTDHRPDGDATAEYVGRVAHVVTLASASPDSADRLAFVLRLPAVVEGGLLVLGNAASVSHTSGWKNGKLREGKERVKSYVCCMTLNLFMVNIVHRHCWFAALTLVLFLPAYGVEWSVCVVRAVDGDAEVVVVVALAVEDVVVLVATFLALVAFDRWKRTIVFYDLSVL